MKSSKLILSITLMAAFAMGTGTILACSSGTKVTASVLWKPMFYSMKNPPPNPWIAIIGLKGEHNAAKEIDPSTILLEGIYSPSGPAYRYYDQRLAVPFSGNDVRTALLAELGHYGSFNRVSLKITGKLYDGTPFSGSGWIFVMPSPPHRWTP